MRSPWHSGRSALLASKPLPLVCRPAPPSATFRAPALSPGSGVAGSGCCATVALRRRGGASADAPILGAGVAVGLADGPHAGLALLEAAATDARLERYQPLHAARAELLYRLGDAAGAEAAYERAIALPTNDAQRVALQRLQARDTAPQSSWPLTGGFFDDRRRTRHVTPPGVHPSRGFRSRNRLWLSHKSRRTAVRCRFVQRREHRPR
jgi:hypothetical protein